MPEARRDRGLRRGVREAFTRRLAYKGAALFFAIVLWFVVSGEEPGERAVPVRLTLDLDSTRTLVGAPPALQAIVTGRTRELVKLVGATLEMRRMVDADAPQQVHLELRPQDVRLPTGIAVTVREVRPAEVMLRFDVRLARRVPVEPRVRVVLDPAVAAAGTPPATRLTNR